MAAEFEECRDMVEKEKPLNIDKKIYLLSFARDLTEKKYITKLEHGFVKKNIRKL